MKLVKSFAIVSAISAAIVGCGNDDSHHTSAADSSYLRVFHAAPDAPKVNVLLDGQPALQNVDYQQSSGQISVSPGDHTVQVDAILADGTTTTVVPATTLDLMAGQEYNVVATGKVGDNSFGPQIIARDFMAPTDARVQVMHSAPDAPTVDVFITAPNADLTTATPFANDVSFLGVTDAMNVPADTYQVRITDPSDPTQVFFDSGSIAVPAGADWFVAATNNTTAGASPVTLLVDTGSGSLTVQDTNSGADVRVVHTISDAPGVDVWVNGTAPVSGSPLFNLMYKGKTDYLALNAASTDFAVAVNGSSPVSIVSALGLTASLAANTTYTALAIGNLGDGLSNDELYVVEDDVRRIATEAKLRAIHASTLAGIVDIYVSADATPSSDDVILEDIPYKGDSGLLPVMPGTVYIMITPANTPSTIAIGPVMLDLTGGSITTLVAIDDPVAPTSVSAISLDD
ncbi:DUF4397 domain-containing protein [Vibrio sp. THAF190c]|uniref:DUF4397 domain-containing protein n=1 Tax=Vibrio sp. THAF190c TaxID=2587865 RepID=UPI001268A97D|nr:DUF4397 domain-containing protein [Vibrio sp. THAF190c]QFT11073.1 hypothetical protein FIV04_14025 [Vibrio sp. THAF190c]